RAGAPGGFFFLPGGSSLEKGAPVPQGHSRRRGGARRQRRCPEAALVPTGDGAGPVGADRAAVGHSLFADAWARGRRDDQRVARFDAVPQPLPTPPVRSVRRRAARILALALVARSGGPVATGGRR